MINNFFRRLLDSDYTYKQTPIGQMMKRELQEDNWDFALYGVGGMKIISVVFIIVLRELGIRKQLKKLVNSLLFCNFIVVN